MIMREKQVRQLFAHHHYTILRIQHRKHWKVCASCGGRTQRFVLPCSPSDRD
jgi:hypothetical protein